LRATAKELVETSGEYSDAYRKGMIKYLEEVDGNFGHATLNLSVEKLKGWVNTTVGGFAHLASRPFGEDVGVSAEILTKAFSAQGDIQAKVASQGGSAILSDLVAIVPSLASSMYGGRAAVRHMNKELLKDATKVASRGVTGSSIAGGLESFNSTYGEFIAAGKTEKEALAFGALSFIATAGLTKGMGATGFDSILVRPAVAINDKAPNANASFSVLPAAINSPYVELNDSRPPAIEEPVTPREATLVASLRSSLFM
jgi:hypothetical protein